MLQNSFKTDLPAFSSEWWQSFLQKTERLTAPVVVENCINIHRRDFFARSVIQVLRELCRLKTTQYGCRIWSDGRLLPDDELNKLFDNQPGESETLADWAARVFAGEKFGIIINTGEKFVDALSQDIALLLAPLFEAVGIPRDGVNYTIFIGNYDKTPLGIHQDKRGENVMHFHLGPAPKTMYLWSPAAYSELKKTHDPSDLAAFKAHAEKKYTFEAGDLFFMPEGIFHIGEQDGFSVGLTVWQYNHSNALLMASLLKKLNRSMAKPKEIVIESDRNPLDDTSGLDVTLLSHGITAGYGAMSYEGLIRETYKDHRYSLHSNAGYRGEPFLDTEPADLDEKSRITIKKPYPILTRRKINGDRMYVYIRGHRMDMNDFDYIDKLISRLNEGREAPVGELLDLLDASWDRNIGIMFLQEILKRRGIELLK